MYKILIADDEPIECMVAKKFIEKHYEGQLEAIVAENGPDALQKYEEMQCRIALLDIEMPGMNGLDDRELMLTLDEAIRLLDQNIQPVSKNTNLGGDAEESQAWDRSKLGAIKTQITNYLEENYKRDVALGEVAATLNYSDAYFCKVFKQCFGVSFVMYLAQLRVRKAKELLADVTINIKEISGMVGYQDPNYFTKVFKRMEDVTPSEYRLRVLNGETTCK